MDNETIAAIATPPGSGGIGIIRISGPKTESVMGKIFQRAVDPHQPLPPHRLCYGHIVAPASGRESNRIIDEVMAVLMPKPASYTREDVAEIQAHAGPAVLEAILDLILSRGVRLAEPGEFTRRAFMNGRIDLTQAEGIIDIITAGTERALAAASAQMRGAIRRQIEDIQDRLMEVLAELEAAIDFPDYLEDEILPAREQITALKGICDTIEGMIIRSRESRILREGLKVVVIGKPNVGKSSLMNALLDQDRAIVTPVPGTTRDAIEAPFAAGGIRLSLIDTAGIHESRDMVEKIGIDRTRQRVGEADLLLFVLDGSEPLTSDDRQIYGEIREKPKIIVCNKWDRVRQTGIFPPSLSEWDSKGGVDAIEKDKEKTLKTSALYGEGIDALRGAIEEWVRRLTPEENQILPNLRHGELLVSARDLLIPALEGLKEGLPPDLIAIDIREAIRSFKKITGEASEPDLLDEIFSRFCIGK